MRSPLKDKGKPAPDESCRQCCISINDLTVKIDHGLILSGVNLRVYCGEVLAIVGPNGAGKTTLLRTIMGEVPFKGGMESLLGGTERRRPRIGYVPQKLDFERDSPISVLDLIVSAISSKPVWMGISPKLSRKAKEVLALFAADHLEKKRIGDLSGGELQRVLLAMAMTAEPELLLLDEPSSGVDSKGLELFYQLVRGLRKRHDIAVIIVTHDLAGISPFVDRIILLNHSIITEGPPQEVLSNEKMLHAFGPSLWNISLLPTVSAIKDKA